MTGRMPTNSSLGCHGPVLWQVRAGTHLRLVRRFSLHPENQTPTTAQKIIRKSNPRRAEPGGIDYQAEPGDHKRLSTHNPGRNHLANSPPNRSRSQLLWLEMSLIS
jgi:hypothetical protein